MKYIIKSFFRPVSNRHYTNKKVSVVLYGLRFLPGLLICLFGAIFVNSLFWIIFAGIIVSGILGYLLFDALLDKYDWKLFWSRFYSNEVHESTAGHDAMKAYESDPSEENRQMLQKHLNNK